MQRHQSGISRSMYSEEDPTYLCQTGRSEPLSYIRRLDLIKIRRVQTAEARRSINRSGVPVKAAFVAMSECPADLTPYRHSRYWAERSGEWSGRRRVGGLVREASAMAAMVWNSLTERLQLEIPYRSLTKVDSAYHIVLSFKRRAGQIYLTGSKVRRHEKGASRREKDSGMCPRTRGDICLLSAGQVGCKGMRVGERSYRRLTQISSKTKAMPHPGIYLSFASFAERRCTGITGISEYEIKFLGSFKKD